jgi:hypothetical protein
MTGNRLSMDAQFAGYSPLRPATLVKGENRFDQCHSEQVRHGSPPTALGLWSRLPDES